MGRVFSPEQIRDGHIPEEGAHEKAGRFVVESLFEPPNLWIPVGDTSYTLNYAVNEKVAGIRGGMIYGSTALGLANLRSDLDVLAIYYPNHPEALHTIRKAFEEAEDHFRVPVEHHILQVGALSSPLEHTIDPLFAKHLLEVQSQDAPRWSYNWPVDMLCGSNIDIQQVRALAIRYCSAKRRQLINGTVDYRGVPNYSIMQRALELPTAIGRKVLAATDGSEKIDQLFLQNKQGIVRELLNRLGRSSTDFLGQPERSLTGLSNIDDDYNELLRSTIEGDTTVEDYSEWLNARYLEALQFGTHIAVSWVEILRNNLDKPMPQLEDLQLPETDTEANY